MIEFPGPSVTSVVLKSAVSEVLVTISVYVSFWFPVFLIVIRYVAFSFALTDCVVLSVDSLTPYIACCVISVCADCF